MPARPLLDPASSRAHHSSLPHWCPTSPWPPTGCVLPPSSGRCILASTTRVSAARHSLVPALLLPFTDFSPPPSTALFPGARGALALRPTHHSGLLPYQSYTACHNRGCAECIPPYLTSNSLAYVMHARLRLLAMRPHVTRHGLPQVRGVCCLCHLALPMYACRRLNLPRSHLARLNLACLTPGSARCYADRPSPLSPHLLNRRGAQSAAICASSAPLPTDLTRHTALQRRRS